VSYKETQVILDWLDRLYGRYMRVPMWTKQQAMEALQPDKACGLPFCDLYGPTKGDVINAGVTFDELLLHFNTYTEVFSCTLKDEMRLVGKDARLFIPANIACVAVGNYLFGAQNDVFIQHHSTRPIKIGLAQPGLDSFMLWQSLYLHNGSKYAFDGAQNDAHFSVGIAVICREFRKRYLDPSFHSLVDRYYDMHYAGHVVANGVILYLPGQFSGQTLTSSDNSLLTLCGLILNAIRDHVSFAKFLYDVFGIVGDDLIVSTSTALTPFKLAQTWSSFGMYLECQQLEPFNFFDLSFCGMFPKIRDVDGGTLLLYHGRIQRTIESVNYVKRSCSNEQRVAKLVSLAMTVFACPELYAEIRSLAFAFAKRFNVDSPELSLLNDRTLVKLFTGLETTGLLFWPGVVKGRKKQSP